MKNLVWHEEDSIGDEYDMERLKDLSSWGD